MKTFKIGIVLTLSGFVNVAIAAAPSCDSKCLSSTVDRYLAQMLKHDVKPLVVAANAITVENGKPTKLGEGAWQTVQDYPVLGHTFTDATTGNVVHYNAVTTSDGKPGSLYVRLKVVNNRIAESEVILRAAAAEESAGVGLLEPDILYMAPVPEARRSPRAKMLKIVDLYLDAISQHNGALVPAGPRCDRYQAGNKFTNVPELFNRGGGTCQSSLNGLTGQAVVNRRFPVVDEALGIAVVHFIIPHAERPKPGATNAAEVFKIVDGKVRSIEEFSFGGAFPVSSGFADEPSPVVWNR